MWLLTQCLSGCLECLPPEPPEMEVLECKYKFQWRPHSDQQRNRKLCLQISSVKNVKERAPLWAKVNRNPAPHLRNSMQDSHRAPRNRAVVLRTSRYRVTMSFLTVFLQSDTASSLEQWPTQQVQENDPKVTSHIKCCLKAAPLLHR